MDSRNEKSTTGTATATYPLLAVPPVLDKYCWWFVLLFEDFEMSDVPVVQSVAPAPVEGQSGQIELVLHEDGANVVYANFARVSATPEEVIVDFGVNTNPFAAGNQEVKVSSKVILGLFTAKRLLAALQVTVARHEEVFGALELDVNKRVSAQAVAPVSAPVPAPAV